MIYIKTKEILELRNNGLTYKQITEHYKTQGIKVCEHTIKRKIDKYYEAIGEAKLKVKKEDKIKERIYEDGLKQILMTGMTAQEFVSMFGEKEQKEFIEKGFKKLRVIAEHSKKKDGKCVIDTDFIEVINAIENPEDFMKRYEGKIEQHVSNGICKKGRIDVIRNEVFNGNTDLMLYMLARLDMEYYKGYDLRVLNTLSKDYEEKIDKYLERLQSIEKGRRKNKTNSENGSNLRTEVEER